MIGSRLSIIITNYNYGRFLQDAIDSALAQTYLNIEVIVVDDGSTDHSRDVIAAAADRIVPVLKTNGGQGSAFNAGFARSTGDIILFLDADDILLPTTGERVVAAFSAQPDAAKVQYYLEVIDTAGVSTGKLEPKRSVMSGDLRHQIAKYYTYIWPPTSGNAFPRRVLEYLLPMPETTNYRIAADRYLADVAPLLGPVITLSEPGARYRQHGTNHFSHPEGRITERFLTWIRASILRMREGRAHQRRLARELGLDLPFPQPRHDKWLIDALHRLISLKLDPARHPVPGDTLWSVVRCGMVTTLVPAHNPLIRQHQRLLHACWFLIIAAAPQRAAAWLIGQYYFPNARGWLARRVLQTGLSSGRGSRVSSSVWSFCNFRVREAEKPRRGS